MIIVDRRYYDLGYGLCSLEARRVEEIAIKILLIDVCLRDATIITSPFGFDKESAEFLRKKLRIAAEIEESNLLIFVPNRIRQAEEFFDFVGHRNVIIVACGAIVACLLSVVRRKKECREVMDGVYVV